MAVTARKVYSIIAAGFGSLLLITCIVPWHRRLVFPIYSVVTDGRTIATPPNSDPTIEAGGSDNSNNNNISSSEATLKQVVMAATKLLDMVKSAVAAVARLDDSSGGAITGNHGMSPLVELSLATYHRGSYNVAISPEPCGDRPMPGIVVVQTLPANGVRRGVARDMWVGEARRLGYRVVFLMGVTVDLMADALVAEAADHRDLLVVGFQESYLNLTLKSIIMIDWVAAHCSAASFLIKVDDDVYLHVNELHLLLTERAAVASQLGRQRHGGGGRQILGVQAERYRPIRSSSSKWYMPMEVYAGAYYPTFAYGPCYILSTDLLGELSAACKNRSYVPYEDVFVNGMCAESLKGVTRYHRDTFIQTKCGVPGTVAVHWYTCWQGHQVELKQLFARASAKAIH